MGLRRSLVASERSLLAGMTSGLRAVGEGVSELFWPTRCVLCDVPGTLLCDGCKLEIAYIDPLRACSYCGQAHGKFACVDCNSFIVKHRGFDRSERVSARGEAAHREGGRKEGGRREGARREGGRDARSHPCERGGSSVSLSARPLDRVASVFTLVDPCRKLITTYKDRREVRLASVLADLLCSYIDPAWIAPANAASQPSSDAASAISTVAYPDATAAHTASAASCPSSPAARTILPAMQTIPPAACESTPYPSTALVVIPARKQALRERGFDHMKRVGEELARLSGLPLLDLIQVNERDDQRGLSASSRQRNMRQSFLPKWPTNVAHNVHTSSIPHDSRTPSTTNDVRIPSRTHDVRAPSITHDARAPSRPAAGTQTSPLPTNVILVDDVLTTGATLNSAAIVLKEMGVHQVFGLTLARLP